LFGRVQRVYESSFTHDFMSSSAWRNMVDCVCEARMD
jgi:hypothetical protein